MFGIGFFELVIIVVVALVFVGPQKLPELMRQMGRLFVQVRRMSSEVKSSVDQVIQDAEEELRREEQKKLELAIESRAAAAKLSSPVLSVAPAGEMLPAPTLTGAPPSFDSVPAEAQLAETKPEGTAAPGQKPG